MCQNVISGLFISCPGQATPAWARATMCAKQRSNAMIYYGIITIKQYIHIYIYMYIYIYIHMYTQYSTSIL